ncbi:transposase [uncultured Mitsuokella sp.]|uniref:RNA-guided endonuclease InsQ/TnpB family protein n=1 Tax=uncultured Mitsuokella sp. TaxID=453120 RepID=UPI0026706A27|nr:transposase [uncultured Mitsuokella sp.]
MRNLLKAFKTEIQPTRSQKEKIIQSIGICRFLYNAYIAYNRKLYHLYQRGIRDEHQNHFVSAYDFDKYVNHKLKKKFPWLNQCGAKARKKILMNAESAFNRFFAGKTSFPRFKKKARQDVKLYFPRNNSGAWKIWRHKMMIPTLKQVRLKEFGYLPRGVHIKNGYVSHEAGRFYVSVTAEIQETSSYKNDAENSHHSETEGIGIDLGIKKLAFVSTGAMFQNINKTSKVKRLEKRLRREQRRLSRKYECNTKKGGKPAASANIEKKRLSVQKLYQRLKNIRMNHENQVIHVLVKQKPRFIAIEDLNIKGLMKNRHLAKSIRDERFYTFVLKLKRKAKIIGIDLRVVNRYFPSSKRCHACGHIHRELKLRDRIYRCPVCGYTADRDFNAALNLRDTTEYKII